jgi:hypothetical protein
VLQPPDTAAPHAIADVIRELKAFRKGQRLEGASIRELIEEGRT